MSAKLQPKFIFSADDKVHVMRIRNDRKLVVSNLKPLEVSLGTILVFAVGANACKSSDRIALRAVSVQL